MRNGRAIMMGMPKIVNSTMNVVRGRLLFLVGWGIGLLRNCFSGVTNFALFETTATL
jgi:hypothetical protein